MSISASGSKVVVIGAGNVASHLAPALAGLDGIEVVQVYSRTMESARGLAGKLRGAEAVDDVERICEDADIYVISLVDDAVAATVGKLRGKGRDALWLHTSGSLSKDVLSELSGRYGVFYPLQTFSKSVDVDMSKVPFFIESSTEEDTQFLTGLAMAISGRAYEADSERRRRMHIAAVFACNFTNYLWTVADDILREDGMTLEVLHPLLEETLCKAERNSPSVGQTGPAVRGDRKVMDRHISLLDGDRAEIYKMLSDSIYRYHHHNEQDKL